MKGIFWIILVAALISDAPVASAGVTRWVTVVSVGGQSSNLFVVLSEEVGADLGCPSTRVVIPAGVFTDADAQKRFYAAALVAVATGQKMQLALSVCNTTYPSMITTDYWFLQNT
jgi:hypothetical protein